MELDQQVAFVTGAGSGLGRAAAVLLAREGAKIGAFDFNPDKAAETVGTIREAGGTAIALTGDVSLAADVERAVSETVHTFGRLDIVFANAGINGVSAPVEELTPVEWDRTINTNLRGTFLTVKYAVPHLRAAGGGSIIITSSVNGTRIFSGPGVSAYASSKAGQLAFAKMMALELAKDRIRVNAICPGSIESNIAESTQQRHLDQAAEAVEYPDGFVPLKKGEAGKAQDVAELVLFLASPRRSGHITGTPIWIDGAESLLRG